MCLHFLLLLFLLYQLFKCFLWTWGIKDLQYYNIKSPLCGYEQIKDS